jgi:hypothetical protein
VHLPRPHSEGKVICSLLVTQNPVVNPRALGLLHIPTLQSPHPPCAFVRLAGKSVCVFLRVECF